MTAHHESVSGRTNRFVDDLTSRIDTGAEGVTDRAARTIAVAVALLRWPSLILAAIPTFFGFTSVLLALTMDGWLQVVALSVAVVELLIAGVFWWRRRRILAAASDPAALATELGIAVSLSDKADETRGVLESIAGGGGVRLFERLRGLWSGATMSGRWISQVGDLPRARYFVPPTIGTTVALGLATLWLVPISFVSMLLTIIAAIAQAAV